MENESRENEARLSSLAEESARLVQAYQKTSSNFTGVRKEVSRDLRVIVEQIEEIDRERVSEEAKNILESELGDQE